MLMYKTGLSELKAQELQYPWWPGPNKIILTRIDGVLVN